MPESKKKKLEDAEEVKFLFLENSLLTNSFTIYHNYKKCVPMSVLKFLAIYLQDEEQSILAEDEGAVEVPLEGYK